MWHYQNNTIDTIGELPNAEALHGFVYMISAPNGMFYIGKKNFYSKTKKKLTQKELSTDKRLKTYKHVVKESPWKSYWGSNTTLLSHVAEFGKDQFHREILSLAYSSKELTYLEMEHQFSYNILRVDNCYNDNISGRFFRKDLIKKINNEKTNGSL